jgi:hypothetical protein
MQEYKSMEYKIICMNDFIQIGETPEILNSKQNEFKSSTPFN